MGHAGAATGTRPRHVRVLSSQHTQPIDGERRDIQHDDFDENIAANGRGGLYGRGVVSVEYHHVFINCRISKCEPYSDVSATL